MGLEKEKYEKAYTAFTSQFKHLYHPKADVFQIPVRSNMFPLDSASFIKFLNSLNIPVHYWTIDDPVVMRRLIDNGAKGIITDRPDLAIEALKLD